MLRYTKCQYYIETMFSMFCTPANLERLWCLPFGAKKYIYILYREGSEMGGPDGDEMFSCGEACRKPP